MKISELKEHNKPYERAMAYGVESLADIELLAIIIRTGSVDNSAIDLAEKIIYYKSESPSLNNINKMNFNDFKSINGIGNVKAIQLLALVELSKRMTTTKYPSKIYFNSSKKTANYFMEEMRHLPYEVMKLLCLDIKGAMIKTIDLFKGAVSSCTISSREIFLEALKWNATRIILIHNHPSGDPTPSQADIDATKSISMVGKELGINLLDHIIIGDLDYYSLKENMRF